DVFFGHTPCFPGDPTRRTRVRVPDGFGGHFVRALKTTEHDSMNAQASARLLFYILIGIYIATPSHGLAARGYAAGGWAFDPTSTGIAGEARGACDRVCRGGATGADIDGNGVADRQVYVDCGAGSDSATCGAPGSPCRSLQWALDGSN